MKEKIRQHFNQIFAEAPRTRKALDLKQEMMQNAMDKYDDMVADGHSEEDAYKNVIESIGDVSELFPEMEERNLLTLSEHDRKKKATLTAAAVGMYIFAGVVFFGVSLLGGMMRVSYVDVGSLGLVIALLICIAPTVMLVYAANMYPGYTKRGQESMVESYKEARHRINQEKAVRRSTYSILWTLTVALYFIISFATDYWEFTWIIFLIAVCIQSIIRLIFSMREEKDHLQ